MDVDDALLAAGCVTAVLRASAESAARIQSLWRLRESPSSTAQQIVATWRILCLDTRGACRRPLGEVP